MLKSAMIRARIEPGLKQRVEKLLTRLGLNATEAITLYYHQILLQNGLPFEVIIPAAENSSRLAQAGKEDLITKAKAMTPQERLEAYFQHTQLLSQLNDAAEIVENPHAR